MKTRPPIFLRACPKCKTGALTLNSDLDNHCINCGFVLYSNKRLPIPSSICDGSQVSAIDETQYQNGRGGTMGRCSICGRIVQLDRYGRATINHPQRGITSSNMKYI